MSTKTRKERKDELHFQLDEIKVEELLEDMVEKDSFYRKTFTGPFVPTDDHFWYSANRYIYDCVARAGCDSEQYRNMIRKKVAEYRATL